MEYLSEFLAEHDYTLSDEFWILSHAIPGYMPDVDTYWLYPHDTTPTDLVRYVSETITDELERMSDLHGSEYDYCDYCTNGIGDCALVGDLALVEAKRDLLERFTVEHGLTVFLEWPNNGYGEVWTLERITAERMGLTESDMAH